jgi:hypothetical protein
MFTLSNLILNDGMSSFVNEVCFHPNGEVFGATYEHKDEVRLYDARDLSVIKVLRNPGAMFSKPHGLLITPRHVLVTNKGTSPCQIHVFRLDDDSGTPVHTYTTPYAHLEEGHSLALNAGRLVVTYCEGRGRKGALVSYEYDDESGRIVGPRDMQERWFRRYGDAKGITFDVAGEKIYVTFQSNTVMWSGRGIWERAKNASTFGLRGATTRNGIAVFGIDQQGRFTRTPLRKKVFRKYCRLENIHICGDRAVVTNADGGCVELHDLRSDRAFETPTQVLTDPLVFPHGAKLSPDGSLLLVSCNGIDIVNHKVRWKSFVSPRKDCLALFKLQSA